MSQPLPGRILVAAALALIDGGHMVVDSIHRFVLGDFFRIGGQLGPWTAILTPLGVDPLAMGPVFLVIGVAQTGAATALLLSHRLAYPLVLAMAVGTLWYLVFGTLSSGIQILLLLTARSKMSRS